MRRDRFDVLERFVQLIDAPEPSFEGLLRRRDRKRRNQRLAALVVALAVSMVPVLIVVSGGSFDRGSPEPAATQATGTPPTIVPQEAVGVGIVGLAPPGATPSMPRHGEPVLIFMFGHTSGDPGRFNGAVYEDGRMIWQRLGDVSTGDRSTGLIEQRLSSEGVALVVAEVVSTGLFDRDLHLMSGHGLIFGEIEVRSGDTSVSVRWGDCCGPGDVPTAMPTPEQATAIQRLEARFADPTSWLPSSAWEDPTVRAFVPSGYAACFTRDSQDVELSHILTALPSRAEDLLRDQGIRRNEYTNLVGTFAYWCSDLTTDEAREVAQALDDAGRDGHESVFGLGYELEGQPDATEISLEVGPQWPESFES